MKKPSSNFKKARAKGSSPTSASLERDVETDTKARSRYHVEALARGLTALQLLSVWPDGLSMSELAEKAGTGLPTMFRIVQTLLSLGFIEKSEPGKVVRLTQRAIKLGYNAFAYSDVAHLAAPLLQRLHRKTGESVFLSVLAAPNIISVIRLLAPDRLHVVGHIFPAHATPEGKLLLAGLDERIRKSHFDLLADRLITPRGTLTRDEFIAQLDVIREQGWAATDDELALGTRGVAAPVFDGDNRCFAAIAVVSTRYRRSLSEMAGPIRLQLMEVARDIQALIALRYDTMRMTTDRRA